jgi:hypothetical protein
MSDESEPVDLSPKESAVVGVMRRSEMAKEAIFNYAMNFTG